MMSRDPNGNNLKLRLLLGAIVPVKILTKVLNAKASEPWEQQGRSPPMMLKPRGQKYLFTSAVIYEPSHKSRSE